MMKTIGRTLAMAALLGAVPAAAQTAAPRTIGYGEALLLALEQSAGVRLAQNAVSADAATVRQSRQQFLPSLQLTTSGAQSLGGTSVDNGSTGGVFGTTQSMNAGISSSLVLFDGSARSAQLRAAELGRDASTADLTRARQTAVFTVASGFTALQSAQEQLRVRREDLAAREAELAQIQAMVNARTRPVSDLYQQQASVAASRAQLVQAQRDVELGKTDLVQALQLDARGAYEFTVGDTDRIVPAANLSLDSLVNRALASRVDLAALQREEAAAQQGVRAAKAGTLPTVSVSAGYNTAFTSANDAALFDQLNDRRGGSVSIGVSLPLFDRGATSAATQRANLVVDNARIALETQRNNVAVEVRRAYLDHQAAGAQLEAAQAQLEAAQRALDASRERYRVGAAALLEVTQARALQVEAASAVVTARNALLLQRTVIAYYVGDLALPATAE
ncbi:TolC family protein [Longimicrobium terrae]|nr:TolC family protein [Longimicrobium terrae]NNC28527.1 TolC family protein [Longimicrobium terrae]